MSAISKRVLADGKSTRYDVRFRVDGEQRKGTFTRWADAEAYKRKVESEDLAGLIDDPRGGQKLFGSYAADWITTRLVNGRPLTPMTQQGYKALLSRHLEPEFAKAPLRKITPERVRLWYAKVTEEHGADAAAKAYRLFQAILNTAVSDRLLSQNPCTIKGGGVERTPERPVIDTATALDLAEAIDPRLGALILLVAFGGLRTGELLDLLRRDIDPRRGTVQVERQAHEVVGIGRTITDPKSEAGKRVVVLPPDVVAEARAHLDAYVELDADAPVFKRPFGRPLRRADLSEAWRKAMTAVGIAGDHVHDLRHHALATMARMPGVTLQEFMSIAGHSTPKAALIYQHATDDRARAVAGFMQGVIASTERSNRADVVNLVRHGCAMETESGPRSTKNSAR